MTYEFFQIYYNENQLPELIEGATPHFNPVCSEFFESKVLAEYEPRLCAKYVGSASWDLKKTWGIYNGQNGNFSIPQGLEMLENGLDFLSLSFRRKHTVLIKQANLWHHPENFKPVHRRNDPNLFENLFKHLCNNIGLEFIEPDTLVYEHTFFTTRKLFIEYRDLLRKAIAYIESNVGYRNELLQSAGYKKRLPERAQKEIGVPYFPFTPFILERLLSIWIYWKVKNEGIRFGYW